MDNLPLPENRALSDIVKEVFGDIMQYQIDVPEKFKRPCFLFINPDKSTKTEELTKTLYKETKTYEIYMYCAEDDVDSLTLNKEKLIDYLMGLKKIPIPDTERFFTIEKVVADTDDVNSMVAFMIEVFRVKSRNLRRNSVPKIQHIVNKVSIEGRKVVEDEQQSGIQSG